MKKIIFLLIILLYLFSRFFKILEVPSSVYWDEASIGYNAYSVLKTGRDEWGETLPLHFRAFGEFKLPVYIYATVISEYFLGLNISAVRLPSVFFGLLSIIGLYLIVKKISENEKLSLLSMFIFSISSWFFIFSRTGYEAVAGVAFFLWGIYLFLKFKNNGIYVLFSFLSFLLSFYSYNSFRILALPVFAFLFLYFFLKKKFIILFLSFVFVLVSLLPVYKLYTKDSGLGRLNTVKSSDYVKNYLANFDPRYLFVDGDTNPRSQMPGFGQLYFPDSILIFAGLIFIFIKVRNGNKWYLIFPILLVLAPIPASLTKENPHALRSILSAPVFSVISAIGLCGFSETFKKYGGYIFYTFLFFYVLSFENYFYDFATKYNSLTSTSWQKEYKDTFENKKEGCVEDKYGQPYIFALFYNKTDPQIFWDTKKLNDVSDWGFSTVNSFGNFVFKKDCEENI